MATIAGNGMKSMDMTAFGKEGNPANKKLLVNLFVFFLSIYLLTASGLNMLMTDVGAARIEVIKSIIDRFDLSIPSGLGILGADGREYSLFGIGSVLAALPFFFIGKLSGASPENAVSVMNQIIGAATVVLVFLFSTTLGYTRRVSLLVSIFYGLGTFAWYYAKDPGDHTLETFCVLSAVFFMYRFNKACTKRYLFLSGISLGIALLTRPASTLIIPPLLILMSFPQATRRRIIKNSMMLRLRNCILFIIILLPFTGLYLWYNHCRFGSMFETGYTLMQARLKLDFFAGTPLLAGLLGFLSSPGKGFFYYSPVALLFFFTIGSFRRRHPLLTLCFIWIIISYLLFHSKNVYWHGDWAWGPRYIFVTTPFLVIPLAELFASPTWQSSPLLKRGVMVLFALSVAIQLVAVSVHTYKYFVFLRQEKKVPFTTVGGKGIPSINEPRPETYFDWRLSPILTQVKFVNEIGRGLKEYRVKDSAHASGYEQIKSQPWMNLYDFWWLYKYYIENSPAGFLAAAVLLLSALASGLKLLNDIGSS
jgi:hypothetical protein